MIPPEVIEGLNQETTESAEAAAEILRSQVIDIAVNHVRAMLEVDRGISLLVEAGLAAIGEEIPIHVFHDTLAVHYEEGKPIQTRSALLERNPDRGQYGKDKLRIHVPCDENSNPIEHPDRIFVQRIAEDETVISFAIHRAKFYNFTPGALSPDGQDRLSSDEDFDRILLLIDTHMPDITELFEDLGNMRIIPQLQHKVGRPAETKATDRANPS